MLCSGFLYGCSITWWAYPVVIFILIWSSRPVFWSLYCYLVWLMYCFSALVTAFYWSLCYRLNCFMRLFRFLYYFHGSVCLLYIVAQIVLCVFSGFGVISTALLVLCVSSSSCVLFMIWLLFSFPHNFSLVSVSLLKLFYASLPVFVWSLQLCLSFCIAACIVLYVSSGFHVISTVLLILCVFLGFCIIFTG